jgi:phosphoheptose isomerase
MNVKKQELKLYSLLGFDGGEIKNITKYPILAKSKNDYYGPIEDLHMMIFHLFSHLIKNDVEEINYQ